MILHFAYGSNMSRAIMRKHAPRAEAVGIAALPNYHFLITTDGYASVAPARTADVHGILWRLSMRDLATLNAWENVTAGLYRAETLPVRRQGRRLLALTYLARTSRVGRPKAGYMELVIAAALEWQLPQSYIAALRPWLPKRAVGAGPRKLEDFGWK